jgi:hypothetical protein
MKRWKTLMKLSWTIDFDQSYPNRSDLTASQESQRLHQRFVESKLTIRPPEPIPELLERRKNGRVERSSPPKPQLTAVPAIPLSAAQIREARKSKGGVSQTRRHLRCLPTVDFSP